ncbi:TPA: co-chaperone HscB, partial [Vibrio parahaemolyticus]|nr:co-chaperone HscB [Vibrio parahaemolyticus]
MNHFELFGLPSQFQLDGSLLSSKFRELQKRFHPDNFA